MQLDHNHNRSQRRRRKNCMCYAMDSISPHEKPCQELKSKKFWAGVFGEFLGTMFLIYIVSSVTNLPSSVGDSAGLYTALAYGLGAASLVHWTEGLLNPALAVAFCSTGKLSFIKGVLFIIMEIVGGIAGAALTYALSSSKFRPQLSLGDTVLADEISTIQGLFLEFILTFMLTLAVYASRDPGRKYEGYDASMTYGIAVTVCDLVGGNYTKCGFNPSRSFGAAVMRELSGIGKPESEWQSHWIFWIGPICGALLAGVLYHFLFAQPCEEYDLYESAVSRHNQPDSETVL